MKSPIRSHRQPLALVLAAALSTAGGCVAVGSEPAPQDTEGATAPAVVESRELSASPVDWKERLEEPYVYVEHQGDYRVLGATMRQLLERARLAGVEASGPPFTLFFDDPAEVPAARLRARVCLPVRAGASGAPGLRADLLPRAMVVYASVSGAYPELPRVYPALFRYAEDHGWSVRGPLREIYFVDPGTVTDWRQLESEIQVPWVPGG